MKLDIPFTSYDFYAYLISGLCVIFAFNHAFGSDSLFNPGSVSLLGGVVIAIAGYALGQILASLSVIFLEARVGGDFRAST